MSDPAIDAARRAWVESGRVPLPTQQDLRGRIAAAREMAKSVQELHHKTKVRDFGFSDDRPWVDVCAECSVIGRHILWPCKTAKRVYPSEELGL